MEVFQHMFQCSRKRESIQDLSITQDKKRDSHQDENHNVNNFLKSSFTKNEQSSSKNISNQSHTNNNKEHASIEFSHELNCYYIKDNESTNGTFLILEEKDNIQIINEMKFKILET